MSPSRQTFRGERYVVLDKREGGRERGREGERGKDEWATWKGNMIMFRDAPLRLVVRERTIEPYERVKAYVDQEWTPDMMTWDGWRRWWWYGKR
jgi:hypothetical protein